MIRLPILKDELAFLEKLRPDLETRPDLGHWRVISKSESIRFSKRFALYWKTNEPDRPSKGVTAVFWVVSTLPNEKAVRAAPTPGEGRPICTARGNVPSITQVGASCPAVPVLTTVTP